MAVTLHRGKRYKICRHPNLSGDFCTIYHIGVTDGRVALFERFLKENQDSGAIDILMRLKSIGHKTGAEVDFFKFGQCDEDEKICYLYAEPPNLRLYCVRFSEKLIIIGGGAPKHVRAWQDDEKLKEEVHWMIQSSSDIYDKIKNKQLSISKDGFRFEGDLTFNYGDKEA